MGITKAKQRGLWKGFCLVRTLRWMTHEVCEPGVRRHFGSGRVGFRDVGQRVRSRHSLARVTGLREFLSLCFCVEKGEPGRGAWEKGNEKSHSSHCARVGSRAQSKPFLLTEQDTWHEQRARQRRFCPSGEDP